MDAIIQTIIDNSKLELISARISKPCENTFNLSFNARITDVGPFHSVIEPMKVSLGGPQGAFCEIDLPEIETTTEGGDINLEERMVEITDMKAFLAFVQSTLGEEQVELRMEDGHTHGCALGLRVPAVYNKTMKIKGMHGPQIEIISIDVNGEEQCTDASLRIFNPSPFEIELGEAGWEFLNTSGQSIIDLSGDLNIKRGETIYKLRGQNLKEDSAANPSRIGIAKGVSALGGFWSNSAIKTLNLPVMLPGQRSAVNSSGLANVADR